MKKSLKFLALVLSLVMVVACFAACSDKKDGESKDDAGQTTVTDKTVSDKSDKPKVAESTPVDVVTKAFSAIESGNIKESKEFFTDENIFNELIMSNINMDEIAQSFGNPEEFGLTEDEFNEMIEDFMAKILGEIEFDVGEAKIDGDTAEVEVKMSSPDFEAINYEEIITEDLFIEAIENAGYSMEELENMSEEEGMEIMPDIMKSMLDTIGDAFVDALRNTEKTEVSGTLTLEKIDDQWVIVG